VGSDDARGLPERLGNAHGRDLGSGRVESGVYGAGEVDVLSDQSALECGSRDCKPCERHGDPLNEHMLAVVSAKMCRSIASVSMIEGQRRESWEESR